LVALVEQQQTGALERDQFLDGVETRVVDLLLRLMMYQEFAQVADDIEERGRRRRRAGRRSADLVPVQLDGRVEPHVLGERGTRLDGLCLDGQHDAAERDLVAGAHFARPDDALAVHGRAIAAAEILQDERIRTAFEHGVFARDGAIGKGNREIRAASDPGGAGGHGPALHCFVDPPYELDVHASTVSLPRGERQVTAPRAARSTNQLPRPSRGATRCAGSVASPSPARTRARIGAFVAPVTTKKTARACASAASVRVSRGAMRGAGVATTQRSRSAS